MGRLLFRNDDERKRAHKAGIKDLDQVYTRDEMVTEDVIFAATGVTDGSIVRGARRDGEWMETETHPDALEDRLGAPAALPPAQPVIRFPLRRQRHG